MLCCKAVYGGRLWRPVLILEFARLVQQSLGTSVYIFFGHPGHYNVRYCGDRVKRGQLNGKSANLNHAILTKLYPNVLRAENIPDKDIIMIMDCDHMVKPEIFMKMGPCMLDPEVAVTLVPQVLASPSLGQPSYCGLHVISLVCMLSCWCALLQLVTDHLLLLYTQRRGS
jgi:cellulose synthase/poly-beta-1,6-N-acetylglucosamine synthase-like glycosyltransferase